MYANLVFELKLVQLVDAIHQSILCFENQYQLYLLFWRLNPTFRGLLFYNILLRCALFVDI